MRLILTEERADFDTIGGMLGTFLFYADTALLLPQEFTPAAACMLNEFYFKFPFEDPLQYQDKETGGWLAERFYGLADRFDFLYSWQIAKQLMLEGKTLDAFYASVLLLGIYSTPDWADNFSDAKEADQVNAYLITQGAEESFVEHWLNLEATELCLKSFPELVKRKIDSASSFLKNISLWHSLMEKVVTSVTHEKGYPVYVVGGYVRDLLCGGVSSDLDFIIEGNAIPVAKVLSQRYGGKIFLHHAFGTARWEFRPVLKKVLEDFPTFTGLNIEELPESMDLISARTEWYLKEAQLPQVRKSTIRLDLQRRDFTINTLGIRVDQNFDEVLDCCGGLQDLANKLIRVLHPRSFVDDPTRIFRAVRYEQRLDFQIEELTMSWMKEAFSLLSQVSGDRIRHELNLMLGEKNPQKNFSRMDEIGLMTAIQPQFRWFVDLSEPLQDACSDEGVTWSEKQDYGNLSLQEMTGYLVLFSQMPKPELKQLLNKLRFSAQQQRLCLAFYASYHGISALENAAPSVWVKTLEALDGVGLYALSCVMREYPWAQAAINMYRKRWQFVTPMVGGENFRAMGIPVGPIYTVLLNALRDAWLDGEITNVDEDQAFLMKLLREDGGKNESSL
ncbi:MAG: hypothetical protein K8R40_08680 [Anaerolineaceae bacterium]|nr:hypothetical protein [Anaerolineaceae bacterium]